MKNTHITGSIFSTRMSATVGTLMGYSSHGANGFTRDEVEALARFYRIDLDADDGPLAKAAAKRDVFRMSERDGLRCMALLGRYLEEGEDPVRLVAEGLAQLGYDVTIEEDEADDTVECCMCHNLAMADKAHMVRDGWIGDACCWLDWNEEK